MSSSKNTNKSKRDMKEDMNDGDNYDNDEFDRDEGAATKLHNS